MKSPLITILGPTATGKTNLATALANEQNGEIISADSRQVFRQMDVGTGKDLDEYIINGNNIPYHLIDIKEPGTEYSLFDFQKDFISSYDSILKNNSLPILCGGTTLYLDSILREYNLVDVPESFQLPYEIVGLSDDELFEKVKSESKTHNTTDVSSKERALRSLRIMEYSKQHPENMLRLPEMQHFVFGISLPMDEIKRKITTRLKYRLKNGMIEEAEQLLQQGVSLDMMKYYGLEYKFLALFLNKEITFNDLFQKLNSAIHQFAKKQMTKYRSMEKNGVKIHWIDGNLAPEDKLAFIRKECKVF